MPRSPVPTDPGEVTVEAALSGEAPAAALAIRHQVFVLEQGIPAALDRDGRDPAARHLLLRCDGRPAATGRVLVLPDGEAVLARIAVLPAYRGRGLGRRVVTLLEELAVAEGARYSRLEPHRHLEAFYRALGYSTVAGTHQVGEHELITMVKRLETGDEET